MKSLVRSLAVLVALLPSLAWAQSAPANLPFHSVYGRLGAGPGDTGPGQAIPFSTLGLKLGTTTSILNYGAQCTGNIADADANAAALTAALATGKAVFIPYCVAGYHFGTHTITVATSQSIVGEQQVLLKSTSSTSFLHVTGIEIIAGPSLIQNVHIDMTGAPSTGTAIRFATGAGVPIAGVQISQVLFTNCYEAIGDEASAANYVVDVKMYDLRMINTLGRQI